MVQALRERCAGTCARAACCPLVRRTTAWPGLGHATKQQPASTARASAAPGCVRLGGTAGGSREVGRHSGCRHAPSSPPPLAATAAVRALGAGQAGQGRGEGTCQQLAASPASGEWAPASRRHEKRCALLGGHLHHSVALPAGPAARRQRLLRQRQTQPNPMTRAALLAGALLGLLLASAGQASARDAGEQAQPWVHACVAPARSPAAPPCRHPPFLQAAAGHRRALCLPCLRPQPSSPRCACTVPWCCCYCWCRLGLPRRRGATLTAAGSSPPASLQVVWRGTFPAAEAVAEGAGAAPLRAPVMAGVAPAAEGTRSGRTLLQVGEPLGFPCAPLAGVGHCYGPKPACPPVQENVGQLVFAPGVDEAAFAPAPTGHRLRQARTPPGC